MLYIQDVWTKFWNRYFYRHPDQFIAWMESTAHPYDNNEYTDGDDDSGFGSNSYFVRAMRKDD